LGIIIEFLWLTTEHVTETTSHQSWTAKLPLTDLTQEVLKLLAILDKLWSSKGGICVLWGKNPGFQRGKKTPQKKLHKMVL